ncbi:glutamate racemase [Cohnella luojiensis]|uniref:Glutamate racemase n=1 Tax=Cohnella luojiensis TaxID=652876 RepID=A0A4Y8M6D0_9BACL|nr:glutamate racemase [Cohnella luojiensis]TFE31556.1 glutamate racemase [Cohnella luojiensis]
MQQAIAVLDSGVGGLTVVKEVMRQLPREKILYFGDTARTPYGPRDAEEVIAFTREIVDYLVQYKPKMIVIACNTATAVALDEIRHMIDMPIIGVINPGARAAISRTKTGIVGVIGTEGTIKSGAYDLALKRLSPRVKVISRACPSFVPLVEDGNFRSHETFRTVSESLFALRDSAMDCLILGCTHYPFLADSISEAMGPEVILINSAEETAREISAILHENNSLAGRDEVPVHQFFCSGDPRKFQDIAQAWLGEQIRINPVVWQVPHIGA